MTTERNAPKPVLFRQTRWATFLQTVAAVGALGTVAVFAVMYYQLEGIRREQSISLRPYISLQVEENVPGVTHVFYLKNPGQDNEIWELGYWTENTGRYPARNLRYKIDHDANVEYPVPTSSDKAETIMIPPGMIRLLATKDIPRSEIIKYNERGERFYRHFYIVYEDDEGESYWATATWTLKDYSVGGPIMWHLVTMEGN